MFVGNAALVVVDMQNDFVRPDGALPVPGALDIVEYIKNTCNEAKRNNIPTIFTFDWHPRNHCSFQQQGGAFPIHCVAGSKGAETYVDLRPCLKNRYSTIIKGTEPDIEELSAFTHNGALDRLLGNKDITSLVVVGVALDYCVYDTVKDALDKGYQVVVPRRGTRAVNLEMTDAYFAAMTNRGAIVVD